MLQKTRITCNQCKSCAVENTAVLKCVDDNCKCHTSHPIEPQKENNWEEEFDKSIPQFHFEHPMVSVILAKDFIRKVRTEALKEERNRITKGIKEKLLKKARQIDYADRTEYDEALEIALSVISKENE